MLSSDLAAGLLQLLGLLTQYAQEKRQQSEPDRQTFQDWLAAHRHEEVRQLLATNHHLNTELHTLLRQDLQDLTDSTERIEAQFSALLSRFPGFAGIARAIHPDLVLSDASVEILQIWVDSGLSQLRLMPSPEGPSIHLHGPRNGPTPMSFRFPDSRFLEDDLAALVTVGLAREDWLSSGTRVLYLTRAGAAYVTQLARPNEQPPPHGPDGHAVE